MKIGNENTTPEGKMMTTVMMVRESEPGAPGEETDSCTLWYDNEEETASNFHLKIILF